MRARFIEDDYNKLGLAFEPEDNNERLLLRAFDLQATANQNRLVVNSWATDGPDAGLRSIKIRHDNTPSVAVEIMDVPDASAKIIEDLRDQIDRIRKEKCIGCDLVKAECDTSKDQIADLLKINQQLAEERDHLLRSIATEQTTNKNLIKAIIEDAQKLKRKDEQLASTIETVDQLRIELHSWRTLGKPRSLIAAGRLWPGQHYSVRGVIVGDTFKFKKAPPGWTSGNLLVVDKMPGYAAPEGWDYFPIELLDGEIELVPTDIDGLPIQPELLRKCMECLVVVPRAPGCKCNGYVCSNCCDCGATKSVESDALDDRDASYGQAVARFNEPRCQHYYRDGADGFWIKTGSWIGNDSQRCIYRLDHLYEHQLGNKKLP